MCLCTNIHKEMQTYKGMHHCMIYVCLYRKRARTHERDQVGERARERQREEGLTRESAGERKSATRKELAHGRGRIG